MIRRIRHAIKLILGLFVPHTVVLAARSISRRLRWRGLFDSWAPQPHVAGKRRRFDYEQAVSLLVKRGVPEQTIRLGSIDVRSMRLVHEAIAEHAPRRALTALHIGNYLGLSLAALTEILVELDPESRVVSIDPNLPHLGITDPQSHALAVLSHFGLQANNVLICGFSLGRSVGDGRLLGAGGSLARDFHGAACEQTLTHLDRLGHRFDVALVDGNHNIDYLRDEVDVILRLLDTGGLLILDDVSRTHRDVRRFFDELETRDSWPLEKVGQNERLGILRRIPTGSREKTQTV